MNLREAMERKLGINKHQGDSERDVVTLEHARARRRISERNHRAAARRVQRRRGKQSTAQVHAVAIATGQELVLTGQGKRGPVAVSPAMRANVERSVRTEINLTVLADLRSEGKPREGTREFDRELRRRTRSALAEVGLEPLKSVSK